jgi:hypothetical protein
MVGLTTMATAATAGETPVPVGWISRPIPAEGAPEWNCANWSHDEWVVSTAEGQLTISRHDPNRLLATFPFDPLPQPGETKEDLAGPSVVRATKAGYLVGYDEGEFGGGLYWFRDDGRTHVELRPPTRARSEWFPDNVHAIAEHDGKFFVFQGLSHLSLRLGRVLKVRQSNERWLVSVLVSLEATPEAIAEERPGTWLVASTNGVSRVTARGTTERLWGRPEVLVYTNPGSIAVGNDGSIYVGMRAWVLRLVRSRPKARWRADLLAPASCPRMVPQPRSAESLPDCSCAGL